MCIKIALEDNETVKFIFDFDWDILAQIKSLPERRFDPKRKTWFAPLETLPQIKEQLTDIELDNTVETAFSEITQKEQQQIFEIEDAKTNSDIGRISSMRTELYPFQKAAVAFLDKVGGMAIIGDEMGLGKTVEAIAYAVKNNLKTLVICPASLKYNWELEVKKHSDRTTSILNGGKRKANTDADFVIVNYDILKKHEERLQATGFDLIVCDEAHYIKSIKAQRTKAVNAFSNIQRRILLSGTPMKNRPAELFSLLNFIAPAKYQKFWDYAKKYCDLHQKSIGRGRKVWDYSGASNLEELNSELKPVMLRRLKSEVLLELPEKQYTNVFVSLSNATMKLYDVMENDFIAFLEDQGELMQAEQAQKAEILVKMNALKQVTSEEKTNRVFEMIDELLDNDKQVVVFSQYLAVVNAICEKYGDKVTRLTGDMKTENRQNAVEAFQSGKKRIFAGTTQTAGLGITLTAGDTMIFVDLMWTPSEHHQAEDRIHRIGQKNNVTYYYLIAKGTIDETIKMVLESKEQVISKAIDGKKWDFEEQESVFSDVLRMMRGKE